MIGCGVFAVPLILYLLTSYPSVAYIDSGELAIVNWTLGIAHPTGYPVYTLVGRLFALLPLELGKTQSLYGAICVALALVIVFFTIISARKGLSILSVTLAGAMTFLLAISPLIWAQGVTNEVYSLHILFVSIVFALLLRPPVTRNLILLAYILGLSFGNHMSTILMMAAVVVYVWINRALWWGRVSTIIHTLAAFVVALSVYFYLPIRAAQTPLLNWGNPANWENFLRHVSGWQYRVWMFDQSVADLWRRLGDFAEILFVQFPLTFWPFVIAGIYWGFKKHRRHAGYILSIMVFNVLYALNFSIPDIDNYLLPSIMVLFIFAAWTIFHLTRKPGFLRLAVISLTLISIPLSLIHNWPRQDQSTNYSATDGVENWFNSCERDALILTANWDYISPWLYLHFYEQRRPDVIVISTNSIKRSWYFDFIRQTDSSLYEYISADVTTFLPQVKRFEAGRPVAVAEIERAYQAILHKIMTYPGRKIYFDSQAPFGFSPPGEVHRSGKLYRLVREAEEFHPPAGLFTPPRFGKSEKYLSGRERRHLDLFHCPK